jgi:hypothetical protein
VRNFKRRVVTGQIFNNTSSYVLMTVVYLLLFILVQLKFFGV